MPNIKPDRFPTTRLAPLAQALVIMDLRAAPPVARGAKLVAIRRAVAAGTHDENPAGARYRGERRRLLSLTVAHMPPAREDLWLLIEAASQRIGQSGHSAAWERIGVTATRGREYLTRSHDRVDWPVWFTLRHLALGK